MATMTDRIELDITVALAQIKLLEARVDQVIQKLNEALDRASELEGRVDALL
jgi:hypothetical protein